MGRKLDEDDVIRVMHQRIVGVSESRARIVASYIPTAEPSASDCWKCNCPRMSNDNKTTDEFIDTKSSRYGTDRTKLEQNTPSEQGKSDKLGVKTGETCTDTISRQAAIDALGKEPDVWAGNDEYGRGLVQGLNNQWHF